VGSQAERSDGEEEAMKQVLLLCVGGILAAVSTASGLTEYRLGGADGNPWPATLSLEGAGDYVVLDENGQEVRRVPVTTTPHGAGTDTLIDFSGTAIQPRFIEPNVNMALTDLESDPKKIPLPYTGGEVQTNARCIQIGQDHITVKPVFDGDPTTAMFRPFTQDPNLPPGYGQGWSALGWELPRSLIVDFGAAVPINRIRFYPRLSRRDDRLLIEEFRDPKPPLEAFGEDGFADNFLAWYEIRVGDNTPRFRKSQCDIVGILQGLPWVQASDPQLEVLTVTRENLDVVVDLHFPTRSTRWVNLRPFPLRNWEIAELEIYGEGFVAETVLITQILDFGQPVNWGKLRWVGEIPEGTRVEIRTRTGSTPNPNLYLAENPNGDLEQITLAAYNKIDVSGRLPPVLDIDHWSFWSTPYDFAAGLCDESTPAESWEDGTPMLSPGPSRYLQLSIKLYATFTAAPRLEQLSLQFGEAPSAQEIVGEIWPIAVDSFAPTTFTYVVRPIFEEGDIGFDRLEILTPLRVDTVHSVMINEDEVDLARFPPEVEEDRLMVAFPLLQDEEDSFKRIAVVFDASVLRFGTEFPGWVFHSGDPDRVRQRVTPGNATFRFSGNVLSVQTPLGGDLLVDVEAKPSVFTPNGDGINEEVIFSYKLREVMAARPVFLRLYNLAGVVVHERSTPVRSGAFRHSWDGRDASGRRVPPGIYLYELTLEAEDEERQIGTFSVVY